MDATQVNPDSSECGGCARRDRRIADLEARLAALEARLAEAARAGKRQAAPFSKGPPKANPKTPGRKPGADYGTQASRAIPAEIDETLEAPLPGHCDCGGTIVPDETGRRIGGSSAWLHTFVGEHAVAYLVARERGLAASGRIIPEDYRGILIHDGFKSHERFFKARHQTCIAHLPRRCRELLEVARGAARWSSRAG
jgi:hypothetical protein